MALVQSMKWHNLTAGATDAAHKKTADRRVNQSAVGESLSTLCAKWTGTVVAGLLQAIWTRVSEEEVVVERTVKHLADEVQGTLVRAPRDGEGLDLTKRRSISFEDRELLQCVFAR